MNFKKSISLDESLSKMINFIKTNGPKKFKYNYELEIINEKTPKTWLEKNFREIIGIIGVGYVGLPLALNFAKFFKTIAYDNDKKRISELISGKDRNLDFNKNSFQKNLNFIDDQRLLKNCNNFIITLPTPLNKKDMPDLKMVLEAVKKLSKIIKKRLHCI